MKGKVAENNYPFLAGGGEMGALTRSKDWSLTSLGNPSHWPQSLRTTLSIVLNAKSPMFLLWGPQLIGFYNDAFRPSLGENGKHPSILGMPAVEAWAEIWDITYPLMQQVLQGGEAIWQEDQQIPIYRNGHIENGYWTFGYSAVKDEEGKIAGILVTCIETTEKVRNIKFLEDNEERFRNTVMQAPIGIAIFKDKDFIVEQANETYLQIVDKKEKDFVGKPLFASLPEVQEAVQPLLENVYNTGIPYYGTEFPVYLNRYGKNELTYFNFVYKALRERDNSISSIIVVATEVTASVKAKEILEESERQFRNMVVQSPIPMTIFRGEDFVIEIANTVMYEQIWRKRSEDLVGKKVLEAFPELKDQKYPGLLREVFRSGKIHKENESIAYVKGDDGMKKFYLDYEYAPLFNSDGSVFGIIVTVNDVTEKVEARKKLEESESRFRNVADSAPVLIWMAGADRGSYYFNKAWLNFTGRTLEQERGNGWIEGIHADDLQNCLYTYVTAFDKQEEFYIEYRLKKNDGTYRWVSNHSVPRFTLDGTFEGYIGACMDIHERIVYQKKLQDDEDRFNIVINASGLGTWELSLLSREINYSDRYMEIMGYPRKTSVSHEELLQRLHPDDRKGRERAFKHAYATGVLHYESRIVWKDQTVHWIETKGKVFYDERNKAVSMIGTLRDITSEKLFQQKLQEREEKFRVLADFMPQLVWTSDPQGYLSYANQSMYNYSGLSADKILEGGWLQIVHPEDHDHSFNTWKNAVKTGKDFLLEHRFRHADGTYRWQLSRAMAQRDNAGNIQMWVGTSTDIQEQKTFASELEKQVLQRTKELKQQNSELEKMNTQLQSFAYVSSHDLQEPLRKIQIFAGRILEKELKNLSETGQGYLTGIQKSAGRMQTLIQDLLAYSRTNDTERILKKTNLEEIVEEVQNDFKESLALKNGMIVVQQTCVVNAIPFQIGQLFHNLIGNSIKFSVAGRPLRIYVECKIEKGAKLGIEALAPDKNYCHISIADNGIGFDPQYKERIFEVFQRLHGKEEYGGTGIGLAIVKKIVDNHGGMIYASGELDKGAMFDIYFPA